MASSKVNYYDHHARIFRNILLLGAACWTFVGVRGLIPKPDKVTMGLDITMLICSVILTGLVVRQEIKINGA